VVGSLHAEISSIHRAVLVEHRLVTETDKHTERQTDKHRAIAYTTLA